MLFRFEITAAYPGTRIVALAGWLREGDITRNDTISVPCTDGTIELRGIVAIEAFHKSAQHVEADGLEVQISLVVRDLESTKVEIGGIATGIRRAPSSEQ